MTAVKCWAEKTNFPAKFECLFPEYPNDISVLLQSFMVENTTERRDGGRGGGGGAVRRGRTYQIHTSPASEHPFF